MRKKQVWRYYCEHCKKAGCASGHMAKHEAHCCANPGRKCRMCGLDSEGVQQPMAELVAALDIGGLDAVRKLANGCPACMLAAILNLRKRDGITTWSDDHQSYYPDFDFKKERDELMSTVNSAREHDYAY